MRASELLTTLSIIPQDQAYIGIYFQKSQLIPFTTIKADQDGNLILYAEHEKAPLTIKELLLTLMKNKGRQMLYWNGETTKKIYGIKESQRKIIV
ncbi:hypothetical protein [Enterococcus mediterraneensis]|uniref:hypothetical protein n=1 Tax=Enterococcus mediterraneensis TaxID=2364791 RepID=UPI000F058B1B|nr:hypothetical protein [Enterococcus mediterraneensis]